MTATFAPPLAQAEIVAAQVCYRPIACDGLPLIGRTAGVDGAYVATGRSVWDMLNAPAAGEAMAEFIAEGRRAQHRHLGVRSGAAAGARARSGPPLKRLLDAPPPH